MCHRYFQYDNLGLLCLSVVIVVPASIVTYLLLSLPPKCRVALPNGSLRLSLGISQFWISIRKIQYTTQSCLVMYALTPVPMIWILNVLTTQAAHSSVFFSMQVFLLLMLDVTSIVSNRPGTENCRLETISSPLLLLLLYRSACFSPIPLLFWSTGPVRRGVSLFDTFFVLILCIWSLVVIFF